MTAAQVAQYYALRASGKTHWEALGVIYNVLDP